MSEPIAPSPLPPLTLPSGNDPAMLPYLPRWNWGAALMQWVWAFAHGLPGVGVAVLVGNLLGLWIVTVPLLGIIGNDLAWRNQPFASYEEFERIQRRWARIGLWCTVIGLILLVLATVAFLLVLRHYFSSMLDFGTQLED